MWSKNIRTYHIVHFSFFWQLSLVLSENKSHQLKKWGSYLQKSTIHFSCKNVSSVYLVSMLFSFVFPTIVKRPRAQIKVHRLVIRHYKNCNKVQTSLTIAFLQFGHSGSLFLVHTKQISMYFTCNFSLHPIFSPQWAHESIFTFFSLLRLFLMLVYNWTK